jgi:hypothetical protein
VLICDGDDILKDSDYLNFIFELTKQHPSVVFFQAGKLKGQHINNGEEMLPQIDNEIEIFDGHDYIKKFVEISHFAHGTTISKLSVLKSIHPYSLDIISSDMHTFLRLAIYGKVCLIKKSVLFWRQHESNASSSSGWYIQLKNLKWIDDLFYRVKDELKLDKAELATLKWKYNLLFTRITYAKILADLRYNSNLFKLLIIGFVSVLMGKKEILFNYTKYKQILFRSAGTKR